ncbi:hypothetical protein T492DRAFT_835644 [Pavlovales sp. CCMP2436]|nr:hypothetical protein T492DRAFT_835644 [Pavlovales sp. CCMP2436]
MTAANGEYPARGDYYSMKKKGGGAEPDHIKGTRNLQEYSSLTRARDRLGVYDAVDGGWKANKLTLPPPHAPKRPKKISRSQTAPVVSFAPWAKHRDGQGVGRVVVLVQTRVQPRAPAALGQHEPEEQMKWRQAGYVCNDVDMAPGLRDDGVRRDFGPVGHRAGHSRPRRGSLRTRSLLGRLGSSVADYGDWYCSPIRYFTSRM